LQYFILKKTIKRKIIYAFNRFGTILVKKENLKFKVLIMKNLRVPVIAVAILLFFFSCKKNDVQAPITTASTNTAKVTVNPTDSLKTASVWNSISSWQVVNQQSFSLSYASISDANITTAVAANGLVLVYKKGTDGTIVRLPFEEKSGTQLLNYWYYQVSNGKVLVTRDSYNKTDASTTEKFQYIIFTADQLAKLNQTGLDRSKLMSINYTDAVKL
jgi:hypothetical protein